MADLNSMIDQFLAQHSSPPPSTAPDSADDVGSLVDQFLARQPIAGGLPTSGIEDAYLNRTGRIAPIAEAMVGQPPEVVARKARPRKFAADEKAALEAKRAQIKIAQQHGDMGGSATPDVNSLQMGAAALGEYGVAPLVGLAGRTLPVVEAMTTGGLSYTMPSELSQALPSQVIQRPYLALKDRLAENFQQKREQFLAQDPERNAPGELALEAAAMMAPLIPSGAAGAEEVAAESLAGRISQRALRGAPGAAAIGLGVSDPRAPIGEQLKDIVAMTILGTGMAGLHGALHESGGVRSDLLSREGAKEIAYPTDLPGLVDQFLANQGIPAEITGHRVEAADSSPDLGINRVDPGEKLYVAKDTSGKDVGSLIVQPEDDGFRVRHIFVDEAHRGPGVAEDLFRAAHKENGPVLGSTDREGRYRPAAKGMIWRLKRTAPEIFSAEDAALLHQSLGKEQTQSLIDSAHAGENPHIEVTTPDGQVSLHPVEIHPSEEAPSEAGQPRSTEGQPGTSQAQEQAQLHLPPSEGADRGPGDARGDELPRVAQDNTAGEPTASGEGGIEQRAIALARSLGRRPKVNEIQSELGVPYSVARETWQLTKDWEKSPIHAARGGTPAQTAPSAAPWLQSPSETKMGQKLMKLIGKDTEGKTVGVRSIVSMLNNAAGTEIRVGREQLTSKRPAAYFTDPHLIRSRNAGDMDRMAHELGHGISTLLRDAGGTLDKALVDLTKAPNSIASARTPEEGMAEWVRGYIQNPGSTSALPITGRIEAQLAQRKPALLSALRDASRAYQAHSARPIEVKFRSQNEVRPDRPGLMSQAGKAGSDFLFGMASRRRGIHHYEDAIYGAAKEALNPSGQATGLRKFGLKLKEETLGNEGARQARKLFQETREHAPEADVEANYQSIIHLPEYVDDAMEGTGHRKGVYVVDDQGNFQNIYDKSIGDIVDQVGKDKWDAFVNYGNMKALLSRTKPEQDFPGRGSGVTLESLADSVKNYEAAHPDWADRFKDIEHYNDALDTMLVQGGLKTPEEIQKIEKYDDYWPLFRRPERGAETGLGSKTFIDPGLRRLSESGSGLPIDDLIRNLHRKTSETMRAYYFKRAVMAPVHMAERVRASSLPQSVKATASRAVVELHPELEPGIKIGEASPDQVRTAIALNRDMERFKEATGVKLSASDLRKMDPKTFEAKTKQPRTKADDIALWDDPIELWQRQSPQDTGINVISLPDKGERRYFQIEDPTLYNLYAGARNPGKAAGWYAKVMVPVVKPWKEAIVDFPTFSIKNIPRDAIEGAIMGHDPYHLFPHFYAVEHLLRKLSGNHAGQSHVAASTGANMAEMIRGRNRILKDLPEAAKRGIALPDYSEMSLGEKAMALPGQISAASVKPINVLLHLIGSPKLSEISESSGRLGAWESVKAGGGSDLAAQLAHDVVTGNFGETAGNADVSAYTRSMGFLNPSIQPTYEFWRRMTHPDPRVRLAVATRLGVLSTGVAGLWALNRLLTPKDRREQLAERPTDERFGYMPLFGHARIPFGPGAPGTWASFTWNALDKISGENEAVGLSDVYTANHILGAVAGIPGEPFSWLPPLPKTLSEVNIGEGGYSLFRDKPIQPDWMSSLPDPADRAYPWTPGVYKSIAEKTGFSPLKTQYFVRSGIAAGYDEMAKAADMIQKGQAPQEAADIPLIGNIAVRTPSGWNTISVQRVSDADKKYQLLNSKLDTLYDLGRKGSPEYQKLEKALASYERAHEAMKTLKQLSQEAKKAEEDGDVKKSREIQIQMVEEAKLAVASIPRQ